MNARRAHRLRSGLVLGLVVTCASIRGTAREAEAEAWPQFRGPTGQGHARTTGLPLSWSETENVVWKTPVPGRGWSSPVIAGDEIWMTTAVESPVSEEEKERRVAGTTNNQPLSVSGKLSLRAVCVDREKGRLLHDLELMVEKEPQPIHTLNSFASPSPVIDDGRLYCHFGTYGTACLDTRSREVVWTNREIRLNHENGPGSTPILWRDFLVFHCDGSDVQFIVALDKKTGKIAWKTDRSGEMRSNPQMKKAYGTPLVVETPGGAQLLSPGSDWLYSYDPATGKELWKLNYGTLGFSIVPRPVYGHGLLYMSTCYVRSELLAVRLPPPDEPGKAEIAWRFGRQVPKMASPLLVGDEIYIVSDGGIATCLDARSGEVHWTERLGGNHSASPLYADGRIHFFSREGVATVIRPGKEFEILGKNELDGAFFASAAALQGAFYLRTDRALYRIAESGASR